MLTTEWSGIYRVSETSGGATNRPIMINKVSAGFSLNPGNYWIVWSTDGTLGIGPWAPPIAITGQVTTGNALQFIGSSGTWQTALDNQTNTAQGLPFVIFGDDLDIQAMVNIPQGWSFVSSWLEPDDTDIVNLWAEVVNEDNLKLLIGMDGLYAPAPFNINTLGNWDVLKGYKVKMNAPDTLVFDGEPLDENTVSFPTGTHIIPVLTNQSTLLLDVFDNPETDILYVFDIYKNLVYWPNGDIFTLTELEPGRGYLANFKNPVTLTFPDLSKKTTLFKQALPPAKGPWTCTRTGSFHLISLTNEALSNLQNTDFIGAFDSQGNCTGYAAIEKTSKNILLTVYGNDVSSPEKDGFTDGEFIRFRSFTLKNNSETELLATFSADFPSNEGLYSTDGLSAICGFKESATGISSPDRIPQFSLYPNPASDELNIVFDSFTDAGKIHIELVNSNGSKVIESDILQINTKLNIGNLQPGIYILKIKQSGDVTYRKVVVK